MEEEDRSEDLLLGTREADAVQKWLTDNAKKAGEWYKDASADQAGIGDDMLRIIGGGAKNVAWASQLPGVKQTLQVLDTPPWILGKVGGAAAEAAGIDPRIGGAIGNIGGSFMTLGGVAKVGKVGAIKGAQKLYKTQLPGSQLAGKGLTRHYVGKAADARKAQLGLMKREVGGQSQAIRRGELNLQAVMSNLEPARWQKQYAQLPDQLSRERFLKRGFGGKIKSMYVEGGKISARSLAKDPTTMQKLMDRADRITERFRAGDQRKLYDEASWNIFEEAKQVYGDTALVKKVQAAFLGVQGKQWHHIFGNKEAGEFLLNSVAQDPVVAANLFKHMDNLNLKSGAIAENMALMRNAPHNSWHRFMEDMGIEPRVKMKIGETLEQLKDRNLLAQQDKAGRYVKPELRISKSTGKNQPFKYTAPLDVADFGHAIAEGIQNGTTDINELFTFLTVYHKKYVPWMKQQLKDPKYAAEFLSDLPEGPEKALLLGLYKTKPGTRGMKNRNTLPISR